MTSKVTITLEDADGPGREVRALFHYHGGYNDEAPCHIAAALLDQHLAQVMTRKTKKTPVDLVDVGGHLALAGAADVPVTVNANQTEGGGENQNVQ